MEHVKETIEAIIQLDNVVSSREWNKIAQEYGFLSSFTLRRLYNKNFYTLCRLLRKGKISYCNFNRNFR